MVMRVARDDFVAVLATLAMQREVSYISCSVVTIALKCTVLIYRHGTDRQTDGSRHPLL